MHNGIPDDLELAPYQMLYPVSQEGVYELLLESKMGKAGKGSYLFVEAYCLLPGCDCRRVSLFVLKGRRSKPVAVIEFGFDPDHPAAGPFLNENEKQSAEAKDLMHIFVAEINANPDWLKGMYQRYKQVRKLVDGRAYRGRAFPKPGSIVRYVQDPEVQEDLFPAFEDLVKAAVRTPPIKLSKTTSDRGRKSRLAERDQLDELIDMTAEEQQFSDSGRTQAELRDYLSRQSDAPAALAGKIVELFQQQSESFEAALGLLHQVFDLLRVDLERRRPVAEQRMEQWQTALAEQVYAPGIDPELGAYVTQVLLDTRVEILPLLHQANSMRMFDAFDADPDFEANPEQAMLDLLEELQQQGQGNAFMLFDAVLQLMAVGDAEVQANLCLLMLEMDSTLVRDAAVLMLFHPHAEVREKVAKLLSEIDGRCLTPESLRRLIIARNWFPEKLRGMIDQAVANARRARVDCAPLGEKRKPTVYASAVDGALAQTFQAFVPQGKGFICCSVMLKIGSGVADAFLSPVMEKRERSRLLSMMKDEIGAIEIVPDYLDQRICQALADGAWQGKVPSHWLVAIAEQLGCDQWKAVPFAAVSELENIRCELERRPGKLLDESYIRQSLRASAEWPLEQAFAWSWFEDDVEVDKVMKKVLGRKKQIDPERCSKAIVDKILQPRRAQWLERLVLTTGWAKACKRSPVPWAQLYHVTAALADDKLPLTQIPLMMTIAENTLGAYFGRQNEN